MKGPPLGPGGEDITWPDQVAPRCRKASGTRKIKPQTSNQATSQITGVFERKRVEVPFIGRMKTCDPLNFLVEVVVSDLPRAVW